MKKIIIFLILILLSCKENDTKVEKVYREGKMYKQIFYKENIDLYDSIHFYDDDGNLETSIFSKDTLLYSYENYYKNGNIKSKGLKYNDKFIGEWKFYTSEGKLDRIFEYLIICDSSYLNQGRYLNEKGEVLFDKSIFYDVKYKKNGNVNEKIKFSFKYNKMYKTSNVELFVSPEIDNSFCNLDDKKYLTSRFIGDSVSANIGYSSKGNKKLRGFIQEYLPVKEFLSENADSLKPVRVVYFELPINIR